MIFMCAHRTPVIVNRGWLPRNILDVHMASEQKEDDSLQTVVGVVRRGEVVGNPDSQIIA
jgi:cytochrome oxidase assembly protein ShyY1